MAKRKVKNINQIKEALLSNTDYIKQTEPETKPEPVVEEISPEAEPQPQLISSDVMFKLETLAQYENIPLDEMVNKALNHFLKLKNMQLEEAMKKRMFDEE